MGEGYELSIGIMVCNMTEGIDYHTGLMNTPDFVVSITSWANISQIS